MSGFKITIRVSTQTAELFEGNQLFKTYRISTAERGVGCEMGSFQTPSGLLRISSKIGHGCEVGTVFKRRVPTAELWSPEPSNPLSSSSEDLVLTRILWLEGIEATNSNTIDRYIYLHGTNQEHLLGTPASHGCIRFSNRDVIEIFDLVPEGTIVEVLA